MANRIQLNIARSGAAAWNRWRQTHPAVRISLAAADLSGLNLAGADLSGAGLRDANLSHTNLAGADLMGADLRRANLSAANLSGADLEGADLTQARLDHANFSGAFLELTILRAVDLSETIGLEKARHTGHSRMTLDTFFRSKGRIPDIFLRHAGLPNVLLPSMLAPADESLTACQ
jgi:uncharacterized protein YjbI with pentapeptide repeats